MRALAAVLVVLQLLAALGMFALSVHAPSGLALSAPLYAVASAAFTWWAARSRSWALLVLAGVATLAGPPEERTRRLRHGDAVPQRRRLGPAGL